MAKAKDDRARVKLTFSKKELRQVERAMKRLHRWDATATAARKTILLVCENIDAFEAMVTRSDQKTPEDPTGAHESPGVPCPSPARTREQCGSPYEDIRTTVTDADILALWKNEEPFKRLKDPGKMLAKLKASRPTLNHLEVSNDVILWWEANPAKRKTDRGLTRFLAGWWMRQRNGSEPSGQAQQKPQQTELTAGWNRKREEQPHERRQRENKNRQLATPEEILRVTKDLV